MYIRCWGSRGQLPSAGAGFEKYGGDTTCIELRSDSGELIIIDAGSGIRHLASQIKQPQQQKMHLIFTHLHLDHLIGLPFFTPIHQKGVSLTIHGQQPEKLTLKQALTNFMGAPYFPVEFTDLPCTIKFNRIGQKPFSIGTMHIRPIALSHPNGGLGFRFEQNGKRFVFLTDNELNYAHSGARSIEEYTAFCQDADLLIHDAEFSPAEYKKNVTWGHSSYKEVLDLAVNARVKRLGLFHLNQFRSDKKVDAMVEMCRLQLQKNGSKMYCCAVGNGFKLKL